MHMDEHRFAHRTRSNRPRGHEGDERAGGDRRVTSGTAGPSQPVQPFTCQHPSPVDLGDDKQGGRVYRCDTCGNRWVTTTFAIRAERDGDDWVCELADKIMARLTCKHRAIRERSIGGVLTDRQCIDCGDRLSDREWDS